MNTEQRNLLRSLIEPLIKNTNDNLVINATVGCKANNSFRYQGLSVTALCDIYPGNKVWVFRDTKNGTYYGVREEFNPVLNERTFTRKYIAPEPVRRNIVPSVGLLYRYVPSIRRDEMVTPTFNPYYEQNPELLNDIEIYLLIDGKYTLATSIPLEWRDLGTLEFVGGVSIGSIFPVGPPPTGSATFNQTGNSVSISTSASMGTDTTGWFIEATYSATFSGLALRGSVSASRSFAISSENNGGSAIELIPFESQTDVGAFFDGVNTIGGSSFDFAFTGQSSDTAPYVDEFRIHALSSLDSAATLIIDASASASISLSDVEILCDRQWGRSWSYIDSQGWITWVIVYETPSGSAGYPTEEVRTDGPSYLEERIYGFYGKKNIQRRKIYARRYYDDGTSQYAEGQALEDLVFSPDPVTLEDFRDNPKSVNLEWGATVTPPVSPDECLNDYQTDRLLNYLPTRRKAYDPPTFGIINDSIISGDPLTIEGYRVSSTNPTCDLVPDREYQQRIQAWANSKFGSDPESVDNPPEVLTFSYYSP